MNDIRNSQSSKKGARGAILDQVKNLDTQLKSKQAELKANKSRTNFKNVQELDAEVRRLQSDVDSGNMKIVDEKKALAQISTLRKQRKNFDQFEEDAKYIDSIKEKIADLKKQLDDPESKALSDRYNEITAELDKIKAEQDEAYKNLSTLRDERTALQNLQQEKWKAMKQIQDDHYAAKKAYREWENEFYKAKKERQRAEREKQEREERRKRAEEMLAEASIPAFQDEILTCENLIGYFDPNSPEAAASKTKAPLLAHSESLRAQAQRTVDASGIKGVKLVKKDEREDDYFMAATTTKKKGKKGGKKDVVVTSPDAEQPATPTSGKFQLSIGIIEELRKVNVEAPASQAEVANVLEKLRAKLAEYKANQKTTTEEVCLNSAVPLGLDTGVLTF